MFGNNDDNNNNRRKGTGFTNINRVLTANQGNKLGSSVSSGVQNQAQNVKSQVQTSQQKFNEEAQKNRLDTDENKQHRDNVIGRFDSGKVAVDESNFKVSSGLQEQYNAQKSAFDKQRQEAESSYKTQQQMYQNEYNRLKNQKFRDSDAYGRDPIHAHLGEIRFKKGREKSLNLLNNLIKDNQSTYNTLNSDIQKKMTALESEYGQMTASEKQAFIDSETKKALAAQAPTDEEIAQFAKFRTGTYTGPQQLNDFQTLLGNATETEQIGDLTRSTGGRQELLRRFVGGEGYNQGQQRLDNLLLGQSGTQDLNEARRATRGLDENVMDVNNQATGLAQEFKNRAKIFGDETQNMIGEKRSGFSSKIDEQLAKMQEAETGRTKDFQSIQDMLTSTDEKYKGWDKNARMGLALKSAADSGMLSQSDIYHLTSQGGLIDRANKLGLDTNKLLAERLQNTNALGLDRRAAASDEEEAIISSLDKLAGKTGTDVEFGSGEEQYKAGQAKFNASSLDEYIKKVEDERALKDTNYGEDLKQQRLRYSEQAMQGLSQVIPGLQEAAGGAFGQVTDNFNIFKPGEALQNGSEIIDGLGNAAIGNAQMVQQGGNALMEGLLKLNVGGNSLAQSEAGKQLLKAIEFQSMIQNEVYGAGRDVLKGATSGLSELGKGNISQGLENILKGGTDVAGRALDHYNRSDLGKVTGNISREIGNFASNLSSGFSGKDESWDTGRLQMADHATGKNVKIGSYANKDSSTIMKQIQSMMKPGVLDNYVDKASQGRGYQRVGRLVEYYNAAKKREAAQKQSTGDYLRKLLASTSEE